MGYLSHQRSKALESSQNIIFEMDMGSNERIARIMKYLDNEVCLKGDSSHFISSIKEVVKSKMPKLYIPDMDIELTQWLNFSSTLLTAPDSELIGTLNQHLRLRTYLVQHVLSIADVAVFDVVSSNVQLLDSLETDTRRWFDCIQNQLVGVKIVPVVQFQPTIFAISSAPTKTITSSIVETTALKGGAPEKPVEKEKGDKKKDKGPSSCISICEPSAASADADLDPSKLQLLVGKIVKCWDHPESDKLLCEEIDVGEAVLRSIASGLRAHYTKEEVKSFLLHIIPTRIYFK